MTISKAIQGLCIVRLCQKSAIFAREERPSKECSGNGPVMNWNLSSQESLRGLLTQSCVMRKGPSWPELVSYQKKDRIPKEGSSFGMTPTF